MYGKCNFATGIEVYCSGKSIGAVVWCKVHARPIIIGTKVVKVVKVEQPQRVLISWSIQRNARRNIKCVMLTKNSILEKVAGFANHSRMCRIASCQVVIGQLFLEID